MFHKNEMLRARIENLRDWLNSQEARDLVFSDDPATQSFCQLRLKWMADGDTLLKKAISELGSRRWRAPQGILAVVSEGDPLGTLEAFAAAYILGSAIRIKAHRTTGWLHRLRDHLELDETQCDIADWHSRGQDDERLLRNVDTVLLAGSDALIRHYRAITPSHIRLIELGPKISGMAIGGSELPAPELILWDTCLFTQQVCSSPRFILLDTPLMADKLYDSLLQILNDLPPLPDDLRLMQMAKTKELTLSGVLSPVPKPAVFSPVSGWGITYQRSLNPHQWLPYGFQLVTGPLDELLQQADARWPGQLQTLGWYGRTDLLPADSARFTRYCHIGQMHHRPPDAPHDGFFMFSTLVSFIQDELTDKDAR